MLFVLFLNKKLPVFFHSGSSHTLSFWVTMRIISISTNFTSVVEMNILCNLLIFNYKNTEDIHFHNFFKGFLIPNSRYYNNTLYF